jgi:biopolymer transport protein ExbD/biopolymer transport protein TolR
MAYKPKAGDTMSEPNVVPMTDVMLVLLIIMMVITPMLQKGVSVDMARVNNPVNMPAANKDNAMLLSITRDGSIYYRTTKIDLSQVTAKIRSESKDRLNKVVFIKSDARTKYGDVVTVVDDVRAAGIEQLGLLTEKSEKKLIGAPNPGGG